MIPLETIDALIAKYEATQHEASAWVGRLSDADLARTLDSPVRAGARCTIAQGLMLMCMHSQGHSAQRAKMLRHLGGTPPMTDFILWLASRDSPAESDAQA